MDDQTRIEIEADGSRGLGQQPRERVRGERGERRVEEAG